ncbi:AAA family ATPase [Viridibacillus arvi]|uniref:AAA family ATPase n=1 Tax=Viridibacillus arvi TaxID=263475 RepID=UPI0034CEEE79
MLKLSFIQNIAAKCGLNRKSKNSQTTITNTIDNVETPESLEEQTVKDWLYKTEFDENGKIVHCNAYSKTNGKNSSNKIEDTYNDYDGKEIYEEYMRSKEQETEMNFTPSYTSTTKPTDASKRNDLAEGLKELAQVIGLEAVKTFVYELKDMVEIKKEREQVGQFIGEQSLHLIFKGNPGTGKTTIARIVGKIMRGLNVIEKGHFTEVSREDLVVDYIGGTAKKTREVLENAIGGVLFIDEAYSLARGGQQDFGKEAIDTIVKFMEDHNDELIIILAGYTKEMNEFLKTNSGLNSRFPNPIEFPDYTPEELLEISKRMMIGKNVKISLETEKALLEVLTKKQINGRNDTGNGRLVRNLVESSIRKQSKRLKNMPSKIKDDYYTLIPQDFGYDEEVKSFDLEAELNKVVGNEEIKNFVRSLESEVKIRKMRKELGLPINDQALHMIFKGNPGTGKTTIARIMGRMLKELGVVKSGHVVEVTREDLVAGYVGQTAEKTRGKIQEALGGILFIDEVYTLNRGGENDFGKEAIDTLVKQMEEHYENLIVIIAGYEKETNEFLTANSGLKSRFPYPFDFKDYTHNEMAQISVLIAKKQGYIVPKNCYSNLLRALLKGVGKREDGNGRFARTVIEKAQLNLSSRLVGSGKVPCKEDLQTFTPEDFHI